MKKALVTGANGFAEIHSNIGMAESKSVTTVDICFIGFLSYAKVRSKNAV